MFNNFIPDYFIDSVYAFDFKGLYDLGIRGLIFDIDNTLVPDEAPADDNSEKLINYLKEIGFAVSVVSNNNHIRVSRFCEKTEIPFVEKAYKPSTKGFIKAMNIMKTDISNTAVFGDQLITDIRGARAAGLVSYLVKPIDSVHEKKSIKFKRFFEKIILFLATK